MTTVFILIRAAAALGGALLGWILGGPVTRLLYRFIVRKPTPSWLVPFGKLAVSIGVAALVFFYLPLGGGDGWGWGPGWGMGAADGTGKGKGEAKGSADPIKPAIAETATRTQLEIELLGGAGVMDGRFYLIRRQPPPRTLPEVERELKDQAEKLEVHLVITEASIATGHGAAERLRNLLRQHGIPMVEVRGK